MKFHLFLQNHFKSIQQLFLRNIEYNQIIVDNGNFANKAIIIIYKKMVK
jgi:hypothetical protein